jgi:hypothetical protein
MVLRVLPGVNLPSRPLVVIAMIPLVAVSGCRQASSATPSHQSSPSATTSPASASGVIKGTVRGYGGPIKPDGQMALHGQPFGPTKVTIADGRGPVASSETGPDGVFSFAVRSGKYVLSSSCGQPAAITVTPGQTIHRDLRCDVP